MFNCFLLMYRYHSIYYKEVYRPRGRFWYRDAVLPSYRHSYDLIDNVLSPAEEAALDHVLCSPETSYGDVAGQVYALATNYIIRLSYTMMLIIYLTYHIPHLPYTIDVHYASSSLLPSPVLPLPEVLLSRQQYH